MVKDLIRFSYKDSLSECEKCGGNTNCPECNKEFDYCYSCGEPIERHECFISQTREWYSSYVAYTVHLIIDGYVYALAHANKKESDETTNIVDLHIYKYGNDITDKIVSIVAEFVEWIKNIWNCTDMTYDIPTVVKLIGMTTHKYDGYCAYSDWVALEDATQIKKEHFVYEFTHEER